MISVIEVMRNEVELYASRMAVECGVKWVTGQMQMDASRELKL